MKTKAYEYDPVVEFVIATNQTVPWWTRLGNIISPYVMSPEELSLSCGIEGVTGSEVMNGS